MICAIYAITAATSTSIWNTRVIDLVPLITHAVDSRVKRFGALDVPGRPNLLELGTKLHSWLEGFELLGGSESIKINDAFLCFGAVGLIGNVCHRWVQKVMFGNVRRGR
jgi:hypothetical protein